MEKLRSEVSEKIRSAIKAKLLEIGAYVDEELPDYILVMVANKRSKVQMDADLSLFLGSHTEKFTEWLHGVLEKLQQITVSSAPPLQIESDDKNKTRSAPEINTAANTVAENSRKKSEKSKSETKRDKPPAIAASTSRKYELAKNVDEKDDKLEYVPSSIIHTSTLLNVSKEPDNDEADEDYLMIRYDMDNDSAPEEDIVDKYRNPEPPSPARVSPIDESPVMVRQNHVTTKRRVICLKEDEEFHQKVKKPRRNTAVVERVSVKSRIGAVKTSGPKAADLPKKNITRRFVQEEDDEEDDESRPRKPASGISSVVNVTERPRIHASSQANKSLVLKAVAEAEKSIVARKVSRENLNEIDSKKDKPMVDLYTRKYREKHGMVEPNKIAVTFPTRRAVLEENAEEKKENEPETVKERVSQTVKKLIQAPSSPTFIVTLDKKVKDVSKVDEAMEVEEEEFVEEEIVSEEEEEEEEPQGMVVNGKINERCKFWPACRLGDQCLYKHPSKLCKKFPACAFGDKCIYIHPNCRYDGACNRQQCPFTHATPRNRSIVPAVKVPAVNMLMNVPVCKYFPRCTNSSCQFLHPTPCKFGASCTRLGCAFTHPPAPKLPSGPPKKLLKWVAPGLKKESL